MDVSFKYFRLPSVKVSPFPQKSETFTQPKNLGNHLKRAKALQNFDYLSCTLHNLVTKEGILDAICVREKQRGSLSDVFIIIPQRIKSYKM